MQVFWVKTRFLISAAERQDLTPKEARNLEELLGLSAVVQDYSAVREQAIFGEVIED